MQNVRIHSNGAGFTIEVNGLIVKVCNSLGDAWRHIEWMYLVASQKFTVGEREVQVTEWLHHMYAIGFLDKEGV